MTFDIDTASVVDDMDKKSFDITSAKPVEDETSESTVDNEHSEGE